jgi:CDP-diacylglycerol--glycerol-3-phosphate 3-phosphatidyltransferase
MSMRASPDPAHQAMRTIAAGCQGAVLPRAGWATPANLITGVRFALAPVLVGCAWTGRASAFLALFAIALFSDAVDGWVARRRGEASELGARLDTAADFVLYVTVPVCGWWLWPERIHPQLPYVAVLAVSYLTPIALGWWKFGRLTNHHTWGGKLSGVVLALAAIVLVAGGPGWPFRAAVAVVVAADVEEVAITLVLPCWRASVPSLSHVLAERRRAAPSPDDASIAG